MPRRPTPDHSPKAIFRDPEIERTLKRGAEIGVAVLEKYHGRVRHLPNKGAVNLLTQADGEAEEKVVRYLRRRHPGHTIIAEESWDGKKVVPSGYCWILDPLDGTTNYAHGLEHYAFSMAVVFDGRPVAAITVDPPRGHIYQAFKGRGAFRGKKRLSVSTRTRLADSLLVTGFPYNRRRRIPELMDLYGAFLNRTHGVRRFGVASLDLALVAAGQFEGYYEPGLACWDVAAGMLLVTEAGGKITDYEGKPFHVFSPSVVAAPTPIHQAMLRVIRRTHEAHAKTA